MKENRDVRIEELDNGYIVRLDWEWQERPKDEVGPVDRKLIFLSLDEALSAVTAFLARPVEVALAESK